MLLGKSVLGKAADDFYNFPLLLLCFININRNAVLQRICMETATFLLVAALGQQLHIPDVSSQPANRDIYPAGISFI